MADITLTSDNCTYDIVYLKTDIGLLPVYKIIYNGTLEVGDKVTGQNFVIASATYTTKAFQQVNKIDGEYVYSRSFHYTENYTQDEEYEIYKGKGIRVYQKNTLIYFGPSEGESSELKVLDLTAADRIYNTSWTYDIENWKVPPLFELSDNTGKVMKLQRSVSETTVTGFTIWSNGEYNFFYHGYSSTGTPESVVYGTISYGNTADIDINTGEVGMVWGMGELYIGEKLEDEASTDADEPDNNPNSDSNNPGITYKGGDGDYDYTSDQLPEPPKPTKGVSNSGFVTIYHMTWAQVQELGRYMWGTFNIDDMKKFFANPIDAFYGFFLLPLPDSAYKGETMLITVGNIATEVQAQVVGSITPSDQYIDIEYGPLKTRNFTGKYLDYSPYMKMKIYIPYIGYEELDPQICTHNTLNLKYRIDVATGSFTVWLTATTTDGKEKQQIGEWMGNCALNIPLSSAQHTHMISSMLQAGASVSSFVGSALDASSPSDIANTVTSGINVAQAGLNVVKSMKPTIKMAGSVSGGSAQMGQQTPYILYEAPHQQVAKEQPELTGVASNGVMLLSKLKDKGYCKVNSVNLHIEGATQGELAEIKQILQSGVIL